MDFTKRKIIAELGMTHDGSLGQAKAMIAAAAEYGVNVGAAAARENVMGCQFHPEKSGGVGMKILKAFCDMEGRA